jgi:hypothetical protein
MDIRIGILRFDIAQRNDGRKLPTSFPTPYDSFP